MVQASANVNEITGHDAAGLSGRGSTRCSGPRRRRRCGGGCAGLSDGPVYLERLSASGGKSLHASAHRSGGMLVVELEPADAPGEGSLRHLYRRCESSPGGWRLSDRRDRSQRPGGGGDPADDGVRPRAGVEFTSSGTGT